MPEFDPNALGTPNRGTSEYQLDQWNQAMRASPIYQQFMQQNGLATNGRVSLSRQQQASLEAELRAAGFNIPSGMHIDQGGNLNQKNRLVRNIAIGAGIAGGGLAAAGMAGAGPLAGAFGGGGGAAGSAAGGATLPAAATEGMLPMSMANGAGVGAGAGAGAAGAGAIGRTIMGMQPSDLASLGLTGASLVGGAMAGRPNLDPNTQTTDPNLQRLIQTMQGRLDQSEPLYKSIMAMANGLLPTQYQKGGGGMP